MLNMPQKSNTEHPLMKTEQNFQKNLFAKDMNMLRNREGLHAPLKIFMEKNAFKHTGRLSFLQSAKPHLDCLSGEDEMIRFEDFLGASDYTELQNSSVAVGSIHK